MQRLQRLQRRGDVSASFFLILALLLFFTSMVWFFKRFEKNDTKPQGVLVVAAAYPHSVCCLIWSGRVQDSSVTDTGCCSLAPSVVELLRCFLQIVGGLGSLVVIDKASMNIVDHVLEQWFIG